MKEKNIKDGDGPINIFSHLKNITTTKGPYLGDEGWNNYMINKFLSMKQEYVELVAFLQKNTWQMKPEHMYNMYRDLIPKEYVFLKYIKAKNKRIYEPEKVEAVMAYFEVSSKTAKEYINILSPSEVVEITSQIKGT